MRVALAFLELSSSHSPSSRELTLTAFTQGSTLDSQNNTTATVIQPCMAQLNCMFFKRQIKPQHKAKQKTKVMFSSPYNLALAKLIFFPPYMLLLTTFI